MRDDDDDLLAGYDLAAWEAPVPAPGLADAVIARARQAAPVAAVEPSERPVRRWWIAGAIAAVALGGAAFAVWGIQRAPRSGEATVAASTARTLELGPSSAQLDAGTVVHWRRDQHRVAIDQTLGAASWRIAADDTFVIVPGAPASASIEASGASLRVEVKMAALDARMLGASAVTAAAVAMVTVIVYEGQIKVTHAGQTQSVPAGGTLELRGTVPPPDPTAVATADELRRQLDEKAAEIAELRRQIEQSRIAGGTRPPPVRSTAPAQTGKCDEVSCVLEDNEPQCCAKYKKATPLAAACDARALERAGDDAFSVGRYTLAVTDYEQMVACKPDPLLIRKVVMAACNAKDKATAETYLRRTDVGTRGMLAQICIRNNVMLDQGVFDAPRPAPAPPCDADALRQQGDNYLQTGMDAAALAAFEASLACKPDPVITRFAFMAACRAKDEAKARYYFPRLPPSTTTGIVEICARNGIDLSAEPTAGTLRIMGKPAARIFLDGRDTGKTTPATFAVAPGKHKVTYVIGDDKFTFTVGVEPGKTATLVKDLQ